MELKIKIHIVAVDENKNFLWEERQEDTLEEAEKRYKRIKRVGGEDDYSLNNRKVVKLVMFDGETGEPIYVTVIFKAVWGN